MESMEAKVTKAFFESQGLQVIQLGDKLLLTGFEMQNREGLKVLMHFDEGDETVKICTQNLVKIPDKDVDKMYKVINSINSRFRWIKFYIREEDNTVVAEDDAIIQLDSCGMEVLQCAIQLAKIADEAYPLLMKAIYA